MYKKLQRIGPFSCGLFFALLILVMAAIVAGTSYALTTYFPHIQFAAEGEYNPMAELAAILISGDGLQPLLVSLGMLILTGFLTGFLGAIFYNIVAMITGGIKFRSDDYF